MGRGLGSVVGLLFNLEGECLIKNSELLKAYFFSLWPNHDIPITICNLHFMLNNTSWVFWLIATMMVKDMIIIRSINILMSTSLRGFNFSCCLYKHCILMNPHNKTWFHAHMFFTKPKRNETLQQNRLFLAIMTTFFCSLVEIVWNGCFVKNKKAETNHPPLLLTILLPKIYQHQYVSQISALS